MTLTYGKKTILLFVLLLGILLTAGVSQALISGRLELGDGTPVTVFDFDRKGQYVMTANTSVNNSFGSDSYMDTGYSNPDIFLKVCHPNLTIGQRIDLVYLTEDETKLTSVLNYPAQVTFTNTYADSFGLYNCTRVNIDLSSKNAVYPGYTHPVIIDENASETDYLSYTNQSDYIVLPMLPLFFNGSYRMGVNVIGPPKKYLFTTVDVFDASKNINPRKEPKLMTSLLNSNNSVLNSAQLSPGETLNYTGDIVGGETVVINDLLALELKQYSPCDPINESGYYIMNSSKFNYNDTCIVVKDLKNVVVNFGGEQIDGDNNQSMADDLCSVTIENSQDVTLENLRVYQYYYGICIKNSSVTLYGDGAKYNEFGAIVFDNSTATFVDISFDNIDSEIVSKDNSTIRLVKLNFSTAFLKSTFRDVVVRSVKNLPPLLNVSNMMHIDQFIQYEANGPDAYAQISFYYHEPMPNGVVTNNLSIYEYNGSYNITNVTRFDNVTNTSYVDQVQQWEGGDWKKIFTIISPSESLIIGPNQSNFSVFAPFGFSTISKGESEPGDGNDSGTTPRPQPTPQPEAGSTEGGGGTPARADYKDIINVGPLKPIIIQLDLPDNITLAQGEAGDVVFNISNLGDGKPSELIVRPLPRPGWDYTNTSVYNLEPGETRQDSFQLAPYIKEIPGKYTLVAKVYFPSVNGTAAIASDVMTVYVLPRGDLKRLRVLEYPPEIVVPPFSEQDISFLVKNIGDANLDDVEVKLEKSNCLLDIAGNNSLSVGQTNTMSYHFMFGGKSECQYNLKFYDGDELVGFVPLKFVVTNKFTKKDVAKLSFMTIFILAWTALTAFVISRRKKRILGQ